MSTFELPDLGEGLAEAEIVRWHVNVGDHVVADQPLLSVETDKAVIEIPSPQAGRIAALHGQAGDVVAVGAALVEFAALGGATSEASVVGELPGAAGAGRPRLATPAARRTTGRAAPAVRALAARLQVNPDTVDGTGPGGTITREDVQRAAEADMPGEMVALRGVRRAMAHNMARAHAEVVPATLFDLADVHRWDDAGDATLRLVRALAAACAAEPALNAWFLGVEQGRRLHRRVDLGIAADTEDGLFVPVLRDVGGRDDDDLRRGLDRMKADIRARTIPPEELRNATITLSNFGMLGGEHAALVVIPPQVAILGAGRMSDRVVAREGRPAVRRSLPLSLTFDHRAVTGAEAARFMAAVVTDLARLAPP
jgi:pyruvate dehydrogenase E2 component (dihydrolipoamide acetyltransferase)